MTEEKNYLNEREALQKACRYLAQVLGFQYRLKSVRLTKQSQTFNPATNEHVITLQLNIEHPASTGNNNILFSEWCDDAQNDSKTLSEAIQQDGTIKQPPDAHTNHRSRWKIHRDMESDDQGAT